MLKQKYFLTDIFILSTEKQPIKLSWRKIEWLLLLVHIIPWNNKILSHISFYLYIFPYTLSYIYLLLYLCNKYKNVRLSKSLSYIGCNSIIIYLIHWPLWNYILHDFSNKINCYFLYIIMIFLLILSIIIVNKYIPFIV